MSIREANMPLVKGIIHHIEKTGLKKKKVAELAGFSQQEFSDMLNGRKIIRACDVPPIARALNTTLNSIYAAGLSNSDLD